MSIDKIPRNSHPSVDKLTQAANTPTLHNLITTNTIETIAHLCCHMVVIVWKITQENTENVQNILPTSAPLAILSLFTTRHLIICYFCYQFFVFTEWWADTASSALLHYVSVVRQLKIITVYWISEVTVINCFFHCNHCFSHYLYCGQSHKFVHTQEPMEWFRLFVVISHVSTSALYKSRVSIHNKEIVVWSCMTSHKQSWYHWKTCTSKSTKSIIKSLLGY